MEMICTIVGIEPNYDAESKLKAKLKLIFDKPFDGIEINLYEHHVKQGVLAKAEQLIGKKVIFPLQPELFTAKGGTAKLQYSIPFGALPESFVSPSGIPFREKNVDTSTGEIKKPVVTAAK